MRAAHPPVCPAARFSVCGQEIPNPVFPGVRDFSFPPGPPAWPTLLPECPVQLSRLNVPSGSPARMPRPVPSRFCPAPVFLPVFVLLPVSSLRPIFLPSPPSACSGISSLSSPLPLRFTPSVRMLRLLPLPSCPVPLRPTCPSGARPCPSSLRNPPFRPFYAKIGPGLLTRGPRAIIFVPVPAVRQSQSAHLHLERLQPVHGSAGPEPLSQPISVLSRRPLSVRETAVPPSRTFCCGQPEPTCCLSAVNVNRRQW